MAAAVKACILFILGLQVALGAVQAERVSPVTRVVELLQGLAKQTEKEGAREEELYEDYVCWGRNIINQRKASNAAAETRIDELGTFIADLGAGRIEITSERADLEKDIAELMEDMESAKEMRNKETEDFAEARNEMAAALEALDSAIDTLADATKNHTGGVLLAVRASLKEAREGGGAASLAKRQVALHKAVELGGRFLDKADAKFLGRVLLGEVPEVADRKKLNRKATFKMGYKARSFKIQGVLQKMRQAFQSNMDEAKQAESDATAHYEKLSRAKEQQLDAARYALNKAESENGAKGMTREESEDQVEALKQQIENDNRFIEQTQKALSDKIAAWKKRSGLRAAEQAAISKAIHTLHNGDARDVFKKSFASQGFLQVRQTSHKAMEHREQKAGAALRDAAIRSGDKRLLTLASVFAKGPRSVKVKFDPIIKAIDNMMDLLHVEEEQDLEAKQHCEVDRNNDVSDAMVLSRTIDERTDKIAKLTTSVEDCQHKLHDLEEEVTKTKSSLIEARKMSDARHLSWLHSNKDDEAAAEIVKEARDTLANFYRDAGTEFLQTSRQPIDTGDALPPPPTWEGGFAEKTGEAQGIVAIMDMIHEDILKDLADAKADEEAAAAEYVDFKEDSEHQLELLQKESSSTGTDLGRAQRNKIEEQEQRRTDHESLDSILDTVKKINPNCEYYEENYEMRSKNRHIEMDGLKKARALLQGGVFDSGPDPSREIRPGDAASAVLLQSRSRSRTRN